MSVLLEYPVSPVYHLSIVISGLLFFSLLERLRNPEFSSEILIPCGDA